MSNEKIKSIGKIIIVVLAMAIFFFLLLPFLEDDAVATQPNAQKAVPQIFTTNPLSELVRTVYNMFARNHKRPALRRESITSVLEQKPFFAFAVPEETRYAAAPREIPNEENPSALVDTTYQNYTNAGYLNEEGDWVLIRQTAPDAAQRGMHDVNATDKAYDKFLRMERAAKYTAPIGKPVLDIPDSKWAKLFDPIKRWFGVKEVKSPIAPSQEQAFALASASAGLDKNRTGKPAEKYNKALKPDLGNIRVSLPKEAGDKLAVSDLLNPEKVFKDTAEQLKNKAHELLDPQEANKMDKQIDRQVRINFQKTRQEIEEFTQNQLAMDLAAEQEANIQTNISLINKTLSCDESSYTSFYRGEEGACSASAAAAVAQEGSVPTLAEAWSAKTGHSPEKEMSLDVVILLDKTEGLPDELKNIDSSPQKQTALNFIHQQENPSEEEGKEKISEEEGKQAASHVWNQTFTKTLYEAQGCDKQTCYWVGLKDTPSSVDLRNIVEQSGLTYQADPLGLYTQDKMQELILAVHDSAKNADESDVLILGFAENPFPAYVPYTKAQMDELAQRNKFPTQNDAAGQQPPQKPFVYFVPSAHGVQNMQEVLPELSQVIYDSPDSKAAAVSSAATESRTDSPVQPFSFASIKSGENFKTMDEFTSDRPLAGPVLDHDKNTGIQDRALQLQNLVVDHGAKISDIIDKNIKQTTEQVNQEITKKAVQKVQKEMEHGLGKDLNSTMGL